MEPARAVAGARADDAAKLDRPLGGRARHVPRRRKRARSCRSSRPGRTRCSARRSSSLAPEHPLVAGARRRLRARGGGARLRAPQRRALGESSVRRRRRTASSPGGSRVNPVNGEAIPIWVADYVLMGYGTGAIMAVPAHDERDHAFAERYGLEIRQVVAPADGDERRSGGAFVAHTENEVLVNSGAFTGLPSPEAKERDHRVARRARSRRRRRSATACATGCSRGSATGAARSRSCTVRLAARSPVPDDQLPVVLPDIDGLPAEGPLAARGGRGLGRDDMPTVRRARQARDGHDGHLRRLVVVLHPLHRPAQRHGAVRPRGSPTTGCRSTSTSAASSMRCCTCSTRASSRR